MNVERFAGEDPVFQKFAQQMAANKSLMTHRQSQALQNPYE